MAAKHSVRVFGTARFILSFGVAILVLLVVWVAVRAVGPAEASKAPSLVLPSLPAPTIAVPSPPSVSHTPSRTPSASPSRTRSSAPTSPTPRPTTKPAVTKTTTAPPPPQADVEATLAVGASWDEGYVAAVRVTNEGDRPTRWRVTVSHSGLRNLELRGVWNATGDQQGDSLVFTGGTLAPGAQASFGYQTSKTGRGKARPSGCNALGGSCSVR
ncbi:cellulose binding domain-containing protein [Paractinoplanes lichenicola]|uniref:Cellulose binding domain-containing protein n=1 Tax=Paractinoplanes lichenicola TaxID=2802976 RepID=A0ABS1VPY1_9ACTN|nr:cellulose binding domain-containing protein [Actinoplanes lichenicola]MBL7256787.1 cellulose binding domain-containing protein [Actinoplanes lichenicola]